MLYQSYTSDAFAVITNLLSTSSEREVLREEEADLLDDELPTMTSQLKMAEEIVLSCPSLSLLHEKEDQHGDSHRYTDRKVAEEHAVDLLNRPLSLLSAAALREGTSLVRILTHAARMIRLNVVSSFALLVDSRLHAYTDLLARHAVVLASQSMMMSTSDAVVDEEKWSNFPNATAWAVNEKKWTILSLGAQVEASALGSLFTVGSKTTTLDMGKDGDVASAMLNFVVTMNLAIPTPNGNRTVIPVSFSTKGNMIGTCFCLNIIGYCV
jgi:hypothetical protein